MAHARHGARARPIDGTTEAPEPLEASIGQQVRGLRQRLDLTVKDVADAAGLSPGMVSKIENAQATPSLGSLRLLAEALDVPLERFFRRQPVRREASYVPAHGGVRISRYGRRASHDFRLLGHNTNRRVSVEPYLVTLTERSEEIPRSQDTGVWFVHLLEGRMDFRYGEHLYRLGPGDSLLYDADNPNGPEELIETPVRYLCVRADARPG